MKKLALVGFRRGRTMTPKEIRTFRLNHFKSREEMAKEFKTTARTIRAYETGENNKIPGIFVKAVELWLENKEFMLEVSKLSCPEADGFNGSVTFPDCGKCIVCLSKIRTA